MTALSDLVAGPDEVLFSRERLRPARPEAPLRRYGGPWHSPSAEPWSSGRTMVFDPGCMMTSGIETVLKPGKRHLAIVRTRHNRAGIPLSVGPVSSLDHRCASALRDKSQIDADRPRPPNDPKAPDRSGAFFVHQALAVSHGATGWDASGLSSIGLAGNCSTVALCPGTRSVTRTIVPSENSRAS
jgi:hypothetical protein